MKINATLNGKKIDKNENIESVAAILRNLDCALLDAGQELAVTIEAGLN